VKRECVDFISREVEDNDLMIAYYRGHALLKEKPSPKMSLIVVEAAI